LGTGNTSGPVILVTSGTDVTIRANTSFNVFTANSTAIVAHAATTVANTLTVSTQLTVNSAGILANAATTVANTLTVNSLLTANVLTVSSINLGTPSIATSGHSRLPNGLLIQWGTVTGVTTTAGTITFPTAFAANPYSVQLQPTHAANGSMIAVTAISISTATVRTTSTATAQTAYYLAIGV
jgi:hypothetical protein